MKYYLIYINDSFFAWSDNKETIKDFQNLFPIKMDIITVKGRVLADYLTYSSVFLERELVYYQGYRYVDAGPIRMCDMDELYDYIVKLYIEFKTSCLMTLSNMKYINISDDIKKIFETKINKYLEISEDIIVSDGECVYDEVIDIPKVIKVYMKEILNSGVYKQ